jgi:hypothetical protein
MMSFETSIIVNAKDNQYCTYDDYKKHLESEDQDFRYEINVIEDRISEIRPYGNISRIDLERNEFYGIIVDDNFVEKYDIGLCDGFVENYFDDSNLFVLLYESAYDFEYAVNELDTQIEDALK